MERIGDLRSDTQTQPTDQMRTGELPRMKAMLMATVPSYLFSRSATVSQSAGMGG